jgi:hypothetical protein
MSVRVRDLEIALVLAREMKAAAERSVDASLRLDQLQEVFGVQELDRAERARIQTALQMAGLEPFPSLLEADPSEPIRFGASKTAAMAGSATVPAPAPAPPPPAEEPPAPTEAEPAFPTVGQFARSKLRSRRFGVRRGDHGENEEALPPPPPAAANGASVEEEEVGEEHVDELGPDEIHYEAEEPEPEPEPEHEPAAEYEPEPQHEAEYEHEPEPEPDQREYIPLAAPEPVAYEEELPEPEPEPARARGDVVAILLPVVAVPVIVTSIAGWRFGLPFVALSLIAAGWVLGREKRGLVDSMRHSPGAGTALKVTGVVTVLSVAAAVALVAVRDSSSKSSGKKAATPAKQPARAPVASKPAPKPSAKKPAKATTRRHHHHHKAPAPAASSPPPDPGTQGLILVRPSGGSGTKTTP